MTCLLRRAAPLMVVAAAANAQMIVPGTILAVGIRREGASAMTIQEDLDRILAALQRMRGELATLAVNDEQQGAQSQQELDAAPPQETREGEQLRT